MRNRQLIDGIFRDLKLSPNVVAQASDFTSVISQVAHGHTATIAPKELAETFFDLGLVEKFYLIEPTISNTVGLSTKEYSPPLPIIEAFKKSVHAVL